MKKIAVTIVAFAALFTGSIVTAQSSSAVPLDRNYKPRVVRTWHPTTANHRVVRTWHPRPLQVFDPSCPQKRWHRNPVCAHRPIHR